METKANKAHGANQTERPQSPNTKTRTHRTNWTPRSTITQRNNGY